ncbi:MAG: response regulator [Sporomusaceae bacterium]|nr:response regulator [Sporomusaceae bacterium]
MRFIIVDDDMSLRKIFCNIVEKYKLGTVIAEYGDGLEAEKAILDYSPDLALVDLLLPGQDGVQLIQNLRSKGSSASFIMISQSSSQPMITQAYQSGIDFYIHKPLNVLEVVSVIQKVEESRRLRTVMSLISETTAKFNKGPEKKPEQDQGDKRSRIYRIFSDLGILGESGAETLYQMVLLIYDRLEAGDGQTYQLHEIFEKLSPLLGQDVKTLQQRVRRTIAKAFRNIASTGIEDYHNDKFQLYSGTLFEFKEVRQEMAFIQGKSSYRGKLNIKKFAESLLFLSNE